MPQTLVHPDRAVPHAVALPPEFRCTLRDSGLDVAWVRVTGELDIATAPQLKQTLSQAEGRTRRVVLDLRQLTFMDTAGVHVIAEASARATPAGRRLVLVRGPWQVDRELALTGVRDRLEIVALNPAEPPVQALVQLARRERAADRRRRTSGLIDTVPAAPKAPTRSPLPQQESRRRGSFAHGSADGLSQLRSVERMADSPSP